MLPNAAGEEEERRAVVAVAAVRATREEVEVLMPRIGPGMKDAE
jgi:hypothetical protein